MPQGRPLDDTVIAAILASIDAGKSRNETAREHEVSASTVSRIAAANARTFDRSKTKNATRAKQADNKALRAELRNRLLVKAGQLLDQMDEPHRVFNFGGKDNTYNSVTLDRPPTGDLRNLMTSAAVAIDKHTVLERLDTDNGVEGAKSMLGALAQALEVAAEHLPDEQT